MDDDAIRGLTVIKDGTVTWPRRRRSLPAPVAKPRRSPPAAKKQGTAMAPASRCRPVKLAIMFAVGALALLAVGARAPVFVSSHFTVFVLAVLRRLHGDLERRRPRCTRR